MKLPLNESMELTEKEKRGGIILPFIATIIAIAIGEVVLLPFGFAESSETPTMLENLMGLFADIVPIIIILLFCRIIEKRSLPSLGIKRKNFAKDYVMGALVGLVLISITFFINYITNSIHISFNSKGISWTFVILSIFAYMIQSFNEELICRGLLMNSISSRKGPIAGILINAIFFGILHLLSPGVTVLSFSNVILFGLIFSLIFYKTNSLWFVSAIHFIWNYFQGVIYGAQVSGLSLYSSVFKTEPVAGRELLNGGAFGFEGGLTVTIIILIAIMIAFVIVNNRVQD